jgi:hypothetical protein
VHAVVRFTFTKDGFAWFEGGSAADACEPSDLLGYESGEERQVVDCSSDTGKHAVGAEPAQDEVGQSAVARGEGFDIHFFGRGWQAEHFDHVETFHFIEGEGRDVGNGQEAEFEQCSLHAGSIGADVDFNELGRSTEFTGPGALQIGEEKTDHFVMQGDELEDAHGLIARVDRKADGTGNAAILTSDEIAGPPRLQHEDTIVEAHGAEDFAMAHTAALDAKKRGIALRGEILLFKSWVCHLTRNETRLAVTHDVRALARHNDPKALGLFFGLILTATTMLLSLCPIAQGSTTAGDATSLVKGTVGQVLEVLSDKQMSQELRQQKVIEIVAGRFDFTDMARSSLGYNWKKLSLAQQEQFVPLFTSFMEDAYLDKIDSYSGQKVQFVGENAMEANARR